METDRERIAELVRQLQSGNNSVFNELYKLTSSRAYFVALEITKNEQDAEDILQESYIKMLEKINSLDKPESFISWFNHIVANKSKDSLKKKKPALFEGSEDEAFEVIPDEDTSFSPEENLNQDELHNAVMEVIDELTDEKRACVMMMYFEEMSVNEIADTLEIPVSTVKNRLFTARKDLKNKFEKRGITAVYSTAPIGVVIWALTRTSEAIAKAFPGSAASSNVLAGVTVAGSTGAAATATTAAGMTAAAGAGGATSTAAGGIAAKIAALTVAQKVVAGVAVAAVV
ncbi:MAG: RNA polymerase sigma factor, partial [Clostridia bacterium]|nr:RNA polymerase sigma factor [Clostridia bacterium]